MVLEAIGQLLPLAAAVALSPIPIIGIVLVLDSARARVNGLLFSSGWVAGLTAVSVVVVTVASGASDADSDVSTGISWLKVAIGAAFLVMAVRQWKKRPAHGESAELPAWMASVDTMGPGKAAVLGLALAAANPKNLALTLAAAGSIAQAGLDGADEAVAIAVFVVLSSITVVGAVAFRLLLPSQATKPLAAVRSFMADNNATIMMVILLIIGLKILGDGLGVLGS